LHSSLLKGQQQSRQKLKVASTFLLFHEEHAILLAGTMLLEENPTPTPTPTATPTPTPGSPSGTFQDDTWQVTLRGENSNLTYEGRNLKTGDSLNLSGATVATSQDRKVYTWYNGDYQYRVSWRPSDTSVLRLQVITPKGKELINSLLYEKI
ncbi:MAG: hypothetical protein AAF329_03925, partial [Cyanobacteria bacterium P01_A01_bin.17]